MTSVTRYDAVIVGGGHNGLVCACYLAAAGLSVRVLERRAVLEDLERKRARFLKSLRLLLERELDLIVVEEGRPSLDDTPVELNLGQKDGDAPHAGQPVDGPPLPGASGAGAPAVGDLWLSGLAGEPPPR